MDEQVIRSLIKWPDVPDCYGWLALDRRGQWRMRDEFTQQNNLPGQVIKHQSLNEFMFPNTNLFCFPFTIFPKAIVIFLVTKL